ncbi:MAG: thioredoxin family protein [Burkholderiales bacterium]|nr:thioredoxin family protein [Burkholderiales bacterium]
MKPVLLACAFVAVLAAAAPAHGRPSSNVAWLDAAADVDVDRALAQARSAHEPLLLYWGARWCPPCNQLEATLFNRQDFALLAKSFVAVHIDGDRPGAQKLGQRFKVSAYPTLLLLASGGNEITRLPGAAEPAQVLALMQAGLAGGRPVKDLLADARAGKKLAAEAWRELAFYSWDTDEGQVLPKSALAATLVDLAVACPASEAETSNRLWLKALAASGEGRGVKADARLRQRVLALLADPAQARAQADLISAEAPHIVGVLVADDARARPALIGAFDAVLRRFAADASLSRADRIAALRARVDLARLDQPDAALRVRLPAPLLRDLRAEVRRADLEIRNGYERQAVIPEAAFALDRAGLWRESDALLKANLAKSAAPYYLMSALGANARRLGHKAEALGWYRRAYSTSVGASTRLQWGADYLEALVELAPADTGAIESTAIALMTEAGRDGDAFDGRSALALQRMGRSLLAWRGGTPARAALARLRPRLEALCTGIDVAGRQRADCRGLLGPRPAA